ncbi:MAG: hypothetical protein PVI90_09390 [Desulfobacteraceae bacterium]|jgi:hypothetical protein
MIFNTLLPHAKALTEKGLVGEDCFILHHCRVDIDSFRSDFEESCKKKKPKTKSTLPVLFHGRVEKTIPGRFQGNNAANVSKNTFQKTKKEKLPDEWFPWFASKNIMSLEDFIALMQRLNTASCESIFALFIKNGPLFTFELKNKTKNKKGVSSKLKRLEEIVEKSVYQVVTCKKPTLMVHSLLSLNALGEYAELFGEKVDGSLVQKELYRFCLLFWMLNESGSLKIISPQSSIKIGIEPKIIAAGNIGDVSTLPLMLDTDGYWLGQWKEPSADTHPIIKKFHFIINAGRTAMGWQRTSDPA